MRRAAPAQVLVHTQGRVKFVSWSPVQLIMRPSQSPLARQSAMRGAEQKMEREIIHLIHVHTRNIHEAINNHKCALATSITSCCGTICAEGRREGKIPPPYLPLLCNVAVWSDWSNLQWRTNAAAIIPRIPCSHARRPPLGLRCCRHGLRPPFAYFILFLCRPGIFLSLLALCWSVH